MVSSNLLTYRELVADADLLPDTIAENPKRWAPVTQQADSEKNFMTRKRRQRAGRGLRRRRLTAGSFIWEESIFIRNDVRGKIFFTTELSAAGEVLSVSTDRIAMVDEAEAADYAGQAFERKR